MFHKRFRLSKLSKQLGFVGIPRGKFRTRNSRPSGGGGGGGGGVEGASAFGISMNLGGITYYSGYQVFIDLVKHTGALWTSGDFPGGMPRNDARLNSDHFPSNLTTGQSCTLLIWFNLTALRTSNRIKPGNYKITWTPTGAGTAVVTPSGDGISSVVGGTGGVATCTFAGTSDSCFISVSNPGGSAAGITDLAMFHVDDEAARNSGEIINPTFITKLLRNTTLRYVRFLDFQKGNLSADTNISDMVPMTHQSWAQDHNGIPPEVIGRIMAKLNVGGRTIGAWTVMHRLATDAYMTEFFTRVKSGDPTGTWPIKAGGANEPWNSGFAVYTYFGGTYYSANSLTVVDLNGNPSTAFNDRLACSFAHHCMRTVTAADAVFGSDRVIALGTAQTDFIVFMQASLQFRDTTNVLYGGVKFVDWLNSRGLRGQHEFTAYFADATSVKQRLIDDFGNFTNAQVRDAFIANINSTRDTYLIPSAASIRAKGFTGEFTIYEGGCHSFWDQHAGGAGNACDFIGTANTTNNTMQFIADGTGWIADGDIIWSPNQGSVTPSSFPHLRWARKTGANEVRLYNSEAAYLADSGNTGVGAATVVTGTWNFTSRTRFDRFSVKLFNLFNSTEGVEVYQHLINNYVKHPNVLCNTFAMFVFGGGSMRDSSPRFLDSFGAHSAGMYEPDRAVENYLETIT